MRLRRAHQCALTLLLLGCASPRPPQPTAPQPVATTPVPITATTSSWTLGFVPGTIAYQISRTGVVESRSDSVPRRETAASSSHETIALEQTGDTIRFAATVDTFSTTAQGSVLPQQSAALPFRLSGFFTGDTIQISNTDMTDQCLAVATALITDIHNLLPQFPRSLSTTSRWNDSTNVVGCQGTIPIRSRVSHSYSVVGETSYENSPVLLIQRADSIHAEGEGAQQQHRLLLTAIGTGNATYYVDARTSYVVHLTVNQDIDLTITTSGKANHFRQNAKQEFSLVR